MKKVIVGLMIMFVLLIPIININAEEVVVEDNETETIEETTPSETTEEDEVKTAFDYYFDLVINYIVGIGGSITGLLVIFLKIKKTLSAVKNGTKSIEDARVEIDLLKLELKEECNKLKESKIAFDEAIEQVKESIGEASNTLDNALTNQEKIDKFYANLELLKEAFLLMCSNDSGLVGSGTAKRIQNLLKDSDTNV